MDEETKKTEPEKPTKTEETGVQSETTTELDRADQIAERLARENERREKLLDREEALAARKAVGGVTEAGQSQEKPKEETDKEYRARVEKEMAKGKTEFN